MKYHVFKQTRIYCGYAYSGPTSDFIPAEFDALQEAQLAAVEYQRKNCVGWNIFDAQSGELVDGVDFHRDEV